MRIFECCLQKKLGMLRSLWRQWVTSRWMPLVLGILFCTAMFAMALLTSGKGLRQLSVTCNWRLLDSVQSWIQHGFWELGGLLSFRDTREVLTGLPEKLYQSQSFLYLIPHYLATLLWGNSGFWVMVRVTTISFVLLTTVASGIIIGLIVEERIKPEDPRWLLPVCLFGVFAATAPQEGIWGSLWNYDDRALSAVLVSCAAAFSALAIRFSRRWLWSAGSILLVMAALACPRMGFMLIVVLLIGSCLGMASEWFNWKLSVWCLIAVMSHYARVLIVDSWGLFRLKGSGPLVRLGYNHEVLKRGQSSLPYESLLDSFTFAWRQSQWMINANSHNLHLNESLLRFNIEHLCVYLLAGLGLIVLVFNSEKIKSKYRSVLFLITAPALLWTILISQSVAEHPDIHAIVWSGSFAVGWGYLLYKICLLIIRFAGRQWAYFGGILASYWLFLWQVQYFLRAYPNLRY